MDPIIHAGCLSQSSLVTNSNND